MDSSRRLYEFRKYMEEHRIDVSVIVGAENQYFLTGFKALIYSRPIITVISATKVSLIVPGLEETHARAEAKVDELLVYYEHPEKAHTASTHSRLLDEILSKSGAKSIGIEKDLMPVNLFEHVSSMARTISDVGRKIAHMRFRKDPHEIDLMRTAGKLVSQAVRATLENIKAGLTEIQVEQPGNEVVLKEVATRYPKAVVDFFGMTPSGVERTVMPHVFSCTRILEPKDILIHSRQVGFNGYHAECERTCFIGKPSPEQERAFHAAVESQRAALDYIRPGVTARDVDEVARKVIRSAGFEEYFIHRTGHGIGLGAHEEPYLRFDNDLVLEEGMAFSIEPGIYIPGLGGFRHSDTVILTDGGKEILTDCPREIQSLVF